MNPPEIPRLRATLGDPRLARLLGRLRDRLASGKPLTGVITLAAATAAERAAADELLGRRPSSGATLAIDLDVLAATLRESGICANLPAAVEALVGNVPNRRAAAEERDAEWAALWRTAHETFAVHPRLMGWLDELTRTGMVKRLCGDEPAFASGILLTVAQVIAALPAKAEPLAAFAARLLGNAHALDPGTARATLAVRAAARLGGIEFEDNAEGRRAAWASVGVMSDELSTPALVFNLTTSSDTPLARILRSAQTGIEPVHLSLRLLLHWPLSHDHALAGQQVYICENPTIVTLAADRLGHRCAPLICANGQFATPFLVLLRQLQSAGACLHYHGDFDPAGLAIARRVMAESGASPWRFGAADYQAAPKGEKFTGQPGATPWDELLQQRVIEDGRAVHEEAVFDLLAADLARAGSAAD